MSNICKLQNVCLEMDLNFVTEEGVETKKTFIAKHSEGKRYSKLNPIRSKIFSSWKFQQGEGKIKRLYPLKLILIAANMTGEFLGTLILTLVICSAVSSSILASAQAGIWQVAIVCGLGVSLSIFCTSYICDAHLNPAITVAFAIIRPKSFSWKKIIPYIVAQMLGGVTAGLVLYFFAYDQISLYEKRNGIERGSNNSAITAMMFGEYFPNPALFNHNDPESYQLVSTFKAFSVEAWTTSILAFVIFSCTNDANLAVGPKDNRVIVPVLIGLTVAVMISIYGSYTQVGMNPARDFGPRFVALCAGWGRVAIPGPKGGFWVYILGPVLGAVGGAALSDLIFSRFARTIKKWKINLDSIKSGGDSNGTRSVEPSAT